MFTKKICTLSIFLVTLVFVFGSGFVSASNVLFGDNFEGYENSSGQGFYSELMSNGWDIVEGDGGQYNNLWLSFNISPMSLVISNDAEVVASVNTLGMEDIQLEYDRATSSSGIGDFLRIYWRVGNSGNWTELEHVAGSNSEMEHRNWDLVGAENKDLIQARFWLDDGGGDWGFLDNVIISGETAEYCGDGILNGDEECDGDDLGGAVCSDWDEFNYGDLSCDANCEFDVSECGLDNSCPSVEPLAPPVQSELTWYTGMVKVHTIVSDFESGVKTARVIFHDNDPNWVDGFFNMSYNDGEGRWEYVWDSESAPVMDDCSVVFADTAGEDNAGNGADNECRATTRFGIDNAPPVTTKNWTDPYVNCEDGEGCDLYVTTGTKFLLSAYEDCGSGVDKIYYRVNNGSLETYEGSFSLNAGCGQVIEYYAVDNVSNEEMHQFEIDNVDDLPPVTVKTFNGPGFEDNYFVTQETEITLTATDQSPDGDSCPVGVDYLYYAIYQSDDNETWNLIGEWNLNESEVTFSFTEDSYHKLVWYSADRLGNVEDEHVQYHIVESVAPVISKDLIGSKVEFDCANGTNYDAGCYFVTQETIVNVTAYDPEPHPVGEVEVWCEYEVLDTNVTKNAWLVTEPFTFGEDSMHELHCWAVDALGNRADLLELDIVDTAAPESDYNILGPYYVDEVMNRTYVDGVTEINLTCEDVQPHPVGADYIMYRYQVDGAGFNGWVKYSAPFSFPEESHHELEYYCVDLLGNDENVNSVDFYVDHTPPETNLTFGEPYFTDGTSEWINSLTEITLDATDDFGFDHDSGVAGTYYRWKMVDDVNCEVECLADGNGTWEVYNSSFTINEDSCHLIEYYSVDNVQKTEGINKKCVYVDNQAPVTNKTVGEPQLSGDDVADLIISDHTPITFECEDMAPHPVNNLTVYWKWRYSHYGDVWGNWSEDMIYDGGEIMFDESSYHELEYWCVDGLGNEEEHQSEIDGVDSDAPVTNKTLGEPQYFDGESKWITQNTTITLECSDGDLHPSGVDKILYRYDVDGTGFGDWINYTGPFSFGEDSNHTLEYYCIDNFENAENVWDEVDKVDTQGPMINKSVSSDAVKPGDVVEICADVHDIKQTLDDGVGVEDDSVKAILSVTNTVDYVNLTLISGEEYCGNWTVPEVDQNCVDSECLWHLEVEAYDLLGNYNIENGVYIVVDGVPPIGEVLTPHAGDNYYAGKIFPVYAPVVDFGGDDMFNSNGCEASGVDYCKFYAIDFPFEDINQSEIEDIWDYVDQLISQGYNVNVEELGVIDDPVNGVVCSGYLQIPEDSNLTDTVFMAWDIVDNAGNKFSSLALNPLISPITMDMEDKGTIEVTPISGFLPAATGLASFEVRGGIDTELTGSEHLCDWKIINGAGVVKSGSKIALGDPLNGYVCDIVDSFPDYTNWDSGEYTFEMNYVFDGQVMGADSFEFLVDNDRPTMGVVYPKQSDFYGTMMPISLNLTDQLSIVDETVLVRIQEVGWLGDFCWGGCEGTNWIVLDSIGDDLYTGNVNLIDNNITGDEKYYFDAIACDALYDSNDLKEGILPIIDGNTRNGHHCRRISVHGALVEDRTECSDGIDNDGDGFIDMGDDGCVNSTDDDESDGPPLPECNDGIDNDGDGLIDWPADPGCYDLNDDNETDDFYSEGVVINEFVPHPFVNESEWIELYNPTGSDVYLYNWTLEDGTGNQEDLSSYMIPTGGYLVLTKEIDFSFGLNDLGDIIILRDDMGSVFDSVTYGNWDDGNTGDNALAPAEGESDGRSPNGSDSDVDSTDFRIFNIPTPGSENI